MSKCVKNSKKIQEFTIYSDGINKYCVWVIVEPNAVPFQPNIDQFGYYSQIRYRRSLGTSDYHATFIVDLASKAYTIRFNLNTIIQKDFSNWKEVSKYLMVSENIAKQIIEQEIPDLAHKLSRAVG